MSGRFPVDCWRAEIFPQSQFHAAQVVSGVPETKSEVGQEKMSERLIGVVEEIRSDHFWIRGDDGVRLFASKKDVLPIRSHYCVYQNQTCSFVLGDYQGRQQAVDVKPDSFSEDTVETADREVSRIIVWFGSHGFARREEPKCGCNIFVHSAAAKEELHLGDLIEHAIHLSPKGDWEAISVIVKQYKQPEYWGEHEHGQLKKHYRIGFRGA
jgi:hypothetical protein